MKSFYTDLHIHIGRTKSGKPVKITASRNLTLPAVIEYASKQKGLDLIGIIDCHSPEVIMEMEELIEQGKMIELPSGGVKMEGITIILGSELEIYDSSCKGPIHVLSYLPTLAKMKEFSKWISNHMKNVSLSSQRLYITGKELQHKVKELNGLFIPAHIFTPFKSLYGSGVYRSYKEVLDEKLIDGMELGLSSDTDMADQISELHAFSFITNSDAHSLGKIAREYQIMAMEEASFAEFAKVLHQVEGRRIIANYGLDPKLGKYHETVCMKCYAPFSETTGICKECGSHKWVKGVAARITDLKDATSTANRPPYIHQIPLEYIPGLGKKTLQTLLDYFSSEMQIIHEAPYDKLVEIIPKKVADYVVAARTGMLNLQVGGGGKYGKVRVDK